MQKNFNKIQSKLRNTLRKAYIFDQVGFVPESQDWFNNHKSMNIAHHINKIKDRNNVIIPIDTEKAFDRVQRAFVRKVPEILGVGGTYLKIIKVLLNNL